MTLVRYRPSANLAPRRVDFLSQVNKELDQIFNEVFNGHYFTNNKSKGYPLMDAIRTQESLICQFTVPGVKLEDINVDISENDDGKILTVSGKLSEEYSSFSDDQYHIRELSRQEFRRSIRLPQDLSEEEPLAVLRNGILTLTFSVLYHKEPEPEIKKVKVLQG